VNDAKLSISYSTSAVVCIAEGTEYYVLLPIHIHHAKHILGELGE